MRLEVTASVGIAFYPEHGGDVDTLLQRADVAMYLAKRDRTGYEIYAASRDHNTRRRLSLLADLRSALEREELFVVYQPKLDLATNRVTGVEALVRWRHPDLGFVSPAEFIPLAEHTGVIAPLTAYVLEQAIRECRRWRDEDMPLHVAVNISARLLHDDGIVTLVTELLDRYGVRPDELVLEVTESCIMSDPRRAEAVLNQLHQHGIRLSIDDFGTGYSSLSYLARLPVSEVKIDRSFVTGLDRDPQNRSIVRSIIDLARGLDLSVTAEGVEAVVVQDILRDLGCDRAQGFLIGRPMHPAALRDGASVAVGVGGSGDVAALAAVARPERPLSLLPGGRRDLPAIAR
jgi:EAL domain-containing protein (putative c-di-GMP-specific phosphodiesterase class I)